MNLKKEINRLTCEKPALIFLAAFFLFGCGGGGGSASGSNIPVSINLWTWMGGSDTGNQPGDYGTKGSGTPTNIPGARENAITWVDGNGNFWLFSGLGYNYAGGNIGDLNDLWKFDGTNWTWISGSKETNLAGAYSTTPGTSESTNMPGARESAVAWSGKGGGLWLFGGYGYDASGNFGFLNDLWKFDGTNWIWVSGSNGSDQNGVYGGSTGTPSSTIFPGARRGAVSWVDQSGNKWLFGGFGYDSSGAIAGRLNDLWKFDSSGLWTWVSGDKFVDQSGYSVSGTPGTADPGNIPGARYSAVSWIDQAGNLWVFGGVGFSLSKTNGYLNDLWKFDGTGWIWMSGSNEINETGSYSTTAGTAASTNMPGARANAVSWVDGRGNLWLYGGSGYDSAGTFGDLSDLWKYDGTNWTWESGSKIVNQNGVYGTKGKPAEGNVPGGRCLSVSWIDRGGSLWLFGGAGYDQTSTHGDLNDLWRYQP